MCPVLKHPIFFLTKIATGGINTHKHIMP